MQSRRNLVYKNSEHGGVQHNLHAARSPELDVETTTTTKTDAAQVPTDREVPTPVGGEEEEHTTVQTETSQGWWYQRVLPPPTSQTQGSHQTQRSVGVAGGQ